MELGDRIAALRKRRGLNQSELARALGLKPQAVQAWEKGGGIRPGKFEALASALGVSLGELLLGDDYASGPHVAKPSRDVLPYAHDRIQETLGKRNRAFDMREDVDMLCQIYAWAVEDGGTLSPDHLIEFGQRLSPHTQGGSDETGGVGRTRKAAR